MGSEEQKRKRRERRALQHKYKSLPDYKKRKRWEHRLAKLQRDKELENEMDKEDYDNET